MQLCPYLIFDGNCQEAFKFYEHSLGGKIVMMMANSSAPAEAQMPEMSAETIIHARLGFSVNITVEDPAEAVRLFHLLSEQGQVRMPIAQTFWAVRFGMLVERFGISWMVNCEQPA